MPTVWFSCSGFFLGDVNAARHIQFCHRYIGWFAGRIFTGAFLDAGSARAATDGFGAIDIPID